MEEIDLKELLKLFWKHKILIVVAAILGFAIGYVYNGYFTKPMYKAKTTFLLTSQADYTGENSTAITTTDVTLNSKIINNYTELAKSDGVLEAVIGKMDIKKSELKKGINISVKKDSEFVELSITLPNKEYAATIANNIIDVLNDKVKDYYNMDNLRVVDKATVPISTCNINPIKYGVIGAAIGFVIAIAIVLLINVFDDTIKNETDVESKLNLPLLASFRKQSNNHTIDWNPKSDYAEGFKALRTNLQFSNSGKENRTISVTSVFPSEGKSWVVTYLAIAYAKADYNVLIVDADLRKGVQHKKFDVDQRPGLVELIKKVKNIEGFDGWNKYIKETSIKNLFVLPSGGNIIDSSELLLSNKVGKIIEELKKGFDIIIFDSTPSALVTDAVVLSRLVDTNIIITESEKTKIKDLKNMKKSIQNVGGNIAGIVLNKVNVKHNKSYYYYGSENSLVKSSKHGKDSKVFK